MCFQGIRAGVLRARDDARLQRHQPRSPLPPHDRFWWYREHCDAPPPQAPAEGREQEAAATWCHAQEGRAVRSGHHCERNHCCRILHYYGDLEPEEEQAAKSREEVERRRRCVLHNLFQGCTYVWVARVG